MSHESIDKKFKKFNLQKARKGHINVETCQF